jgi:hypothetical protein
VPKEHDRTPAAWGTLATAALGSTEQVKKVSADAAWSASVACRTKYEAPLVESQP